MIGKLVLENRSVYIGKSFAYEGEVSNNYSSGQKASALGEVVFNTSMSGYQEIITDPSYYSQIVVMTYPLIGNYGVCDLDVQSNRLQVSGLVVREYEEFYSNFRAKQSLGDYLKSNKIIGIEGIDTRCLTREIREYGALRGIVAIGDHDDDDKLYERVIKHPKMEGLDLTEYVTTDSTYTFGNKNARYNIVVIDYGIKSNILKNIAKRSCFLHVVPASSSASYILALDPDAIFLSNGPGDPASLKNSIQTIKELMSKNKPIFGICLGHQVICLALGAKTYKLKFGHRGANHPIKELATGRIEITSQNHGFAVDKDSIPSDVFITHINLNDLTVAGIRHKKLPIFSIQYHPESSPGPHDSLYLFDEFINEL